MTLLSSILVKARNLLPIHSRRDAIIMLALLAIPIVCWLPRSSGPIDLRWDGGVYYILGTSLAEGKGYKLLNEPGEIEAIQYPPLLPLIVAAHQRALGTSDYLVVGPWLRFFYFVITAIFTVAVFQLARLYMSSGYALLAALVCALHPNTYYLSDVLYTEIPFALVTTLFFILNRKSESVVSDVSTGALGVAAYLLRTAGIALLAAWVAESLLRRRFKQMIVRAAVAIVPVLLWQAHLAGVKDSQQYQHPAYAYQRAPYQYSNVTYIENTLLVNPFIPELGGATAHTMSERIATNLIAMPGALGEAVSVPYGFWRWPLIIINGWLSSTLLPMWPIVIPILLLGCLVIAGMVLLAFRRNWFIPLYCAMSVGLICLTPWPEQFSRYLTPLTPFLTLALFYFLAFIRERCRGWCPGQLKKSGSAFGALIVTMILLAQGYSLVATYGRRYRPVSYHDGRGNVFVHRLFFYMPPWPALDASLEWVRRRSQPGDVIATVVPHWAYLRTGLKAVLPPMVTDSKEAVRLLASVPVRYVVIDELDYPGISQRYARPAIEEHPNLWTCVYAAPEGGARVYERVQQTRNFAEKGDFTREAASR